MILEKIVAQKMSEIKELKKTRLSLFDALGTPGLSVIAEIKKASPSKGLIAEDFDPCGQLEKYEKGGAAAISVLTDRTFFQGSGSILLELRQRTNLPLLRKDFLIDPVQVEESYYLGADAVLLIAGILKGSSLEKMLDKTHDMEMEALVEVHDEEELCRVLRTSARIIGINNRNLADFSVDLGTSEKLVSLMENLGARSGKRLVAESGIFSRKDTAHLEKAGIDAVLVGESLMVSRNPAGLIRELKGERVW